MKTRDEIRSAVEAGERVAVELDSDDGHYYYPRIVAIADSEARTIRRFRDLATNAMRPAECRAEKIRQQYGIGAGE